MPDAMCILGHFFLGKPAVLPCGDGTLGDAANRSLLNFDAEPRVNISDAVNVLLFVFGAERPPGVAPGCIEIPGCPGACTGGA